MSMKTVVKAVSGMDSVVSQTLQSVVMKLVDACTATYGGEDMTKSDILAVQDAVTADAPWKGTSSEGARRSEIKACLKAYPYYFHEAVRSFRLGFGELRRTHILMIARELPKHENWKDAVATVITRVKAKVKAGSGRVGTIGMGLGIIKKVQTRKRNEVAFRKELAALCKKHNINY